MVQLCKDTKAFRDRVGHDRILTVEMATSQTEQNVVGCWQYLQVEDENVRAVSEDTGLVRCYDILYNEFHELIPKLLDDPSKKN